MDLKEAIKERHSVRAYQERAIDGETIKKLEAFVAECSREGGLNMQLILNEPEAFGGFMARYGKFSGVRNYIAAVGPKARGTEEKCGYYGEKAVLYAQTLGLNTCWAGMTYSKTKSACRVGKGEKLYIVIAVGYGKTSGHGHKSKPVKELCRFTETAPQWFTDGVEAASYAPTAMNQQKFRFYLNGSEVTAKAGIGFYTKIDLGIAKYHFEIGAGTDNFKWAGQ